MREIFVWWPPLFLKGPEEPEEADTDQAPAEQVAPKSVSEVGRVLTEEEYEEWKKEREGGKEHEKDGGIDWGMGEIKKTLKIHGQGRLWVQDFT